ncbi:MAG: methionyl-tRNA formyltransferase [Patescibacteria group bacterium]
MNLRFAFFGTPEISVVILNHLEKAGFLPSLIISSPDKTKGRGLELSMPETKKWALAQNIEVLQPLKLDDETYEKITSLGQWDIFIVCAYGKIIPQKFLDIAKKGNINVHPSLLPKYRGPSPIQAQILSDEKEVGTTIMLMDALMDHGAILAQKKIDVEMPKKFEDLIEVLADESGKLLVETLPKYLSGEINGKKQNHQKATVCKMIKKEHGLLDLSGNPRENYLKFLALNPWPSTYFLQNIKGKDVRIKITDADFVDGQFIIKKIIPEGKHEMSYEDFKRGIK